MTEFLRRKRSAITTRHSLKRILLCGTLSALLTTMPIVAEPCTRITYLGPANTVVTGRSMDWMLPLHTNLWAFPAGTQRDGAAGANSIVWTSKYGSVIAAAYDAATADGMNDKGLVANLLYLGTAEYGQRDLARPGLSVAGWAQYVLDNFATVSEAVDALKAEPFQIVSPPLPGGYAPTMHLSISDASGDSAIFEYLNGKLVLHHGAQYQVMTNEPSYDQQLALDAYWKDIGGSVMLPGTGRPADRFVRASYYLQQAPKTSDQREAVAAVFSIVRNVSVPMGASDPSRPNLAATLWRTVSDQTNRIYFFESTTSPDIFWVSLRELKLGSGSPTLKLDLSGNPDLAGDAGPRFKSALPFKFLSPTNG
jgi:penicillin V acylase-like amidase (Ntn superfamily)